MLFFIWPPYQKLIIHYPIIFIIVCFGGGGGGTCDTGWQKIFLYCVCKQLNTLGTLFEPEITVGISSIIIIVTIIIITIINIFHCSYVFVVLTVFPDASSVLYKIEPYQYSYCIEFNCVWKSTLFSIFLLYSFFKLPKSLQEFS